MGDMSVDTGAALKAVVGANPKTKDDFAELSRNIVAAITSRHQTSGLYPAFVEQLAKDLCESLSAVQTRKVSSALSVLGNTKQQEERDKASGKKKVGHVVIVARAHASVLATGPQCVPSYSFFTPELEADMSQGSNKPKLGAAKAFKDIDTSAYDDVLDDDDFM